MLYLAVFSMVHPQGFLEEYNILLEEEMEVGEGNSQVGASPSHSLLSSERDEDSGSQPGRRSKFGITWPVS